VFNLIRTAFTATLRNAYHSLPAGPRTFIAKVALPSSRRPVTVELGLLAGLRLDISPRDERSYIFGTHEPEVQEALPKLVQRGMTVLDIGANIGIFALGMAKLVGPEGRVIAFEPNAASIGRLRRNVELNSLSQVTVETCAVSDYDGTAQFSNALSDTQGRFVDLPHLPADAKSVSVPCCTIDTYLSRTGLKPQFIMMDVEHAEGRVLKGMRNTLHSLRSTLLIEMHGREAIQEAWETLEEINYSIQLLPSMQPINNSSDISELSHCLCRPKS
jgi:FkbM family methyltransferase